MDLSHLFVPTLILVSSLVGTWFLRKYPKVSWQQLAAGSLALIAAAPMAADPHATVSRRYISTTIVVLMVTILGMVFIRWLSTRLSTRRAGSA
jgi:hypothetical protein